MNIVVLGYMVRGPMGGMAWHHLHYAVGLMRLGHDVYFIEDSDDYVSCFDPSRNVMSTDPTFGLDYASKVFARVGLSERWAYWDANGGRWFGADHNHVLNICARAEIALNVSGVNPIRPWLENIPALAYIDTDPAFTQIRNLTDPSRRRFVEQHTHLFTFGENIGRTGSKVPNDGLHWSATRQPICLDYWPVTPAPPEAPFSTVMQWESYSARDFEGVSYGMKAASFTSFEDIPEDGEARFEIVLSGAAPRARLLSKGWIIHDPYLTIPDPWTYQAFIQRSRGEFSVAKQGYVISRCGWFSERSACYLASGRPVILQNTGFSEVIPAGSGILKFDSLDDARDGISQVESRYGFHSRMAREIAEEYFDSVKVLSRLIADIGSSGSHVELDGASG